MYIHIYVCMYMYVCMYVCMYMYMYMYVYIYIYIYIYQRCIHLYVCVPDKDHKSCTESIAGLAHLLYKSGSRNSLSLSLYKYIHT